MPISTTPFRSNISRRGDCRLGLANRRPARPDNAPAGPLPDAIRALKPFPGKAAPITEEERLGRIEKARRLMTENGIGAIVLEPGTSMFYFANVRWGTSERPFLLVIPAKGELAYVSPGFEEAARARDHQVHRRTCASGRKTRTGARSSPAS